MVSGAPVPQVRPGNSRSLVFTEAHPILFFTLDVEKLGDWQRTSVLEPEFHEMTSGKNSDKFDAIDRWCITHPAKVRFLGGPGFRRSSRRARNLYTSGDVFNHNPMFPCALAALVNSVLYPGRS